MSLLVNEINGRYKKIEGYDEYFITENGEVYSYRERGVGWKGLRKLTPKGKNNPKRYLQVCLSKNGEIKYHQIHTLVAKHFCDGYFDGAVVNHIDGDIHNNSHTNLEWITQRENVVKSYKTSGVDAFRNYYYFALISPNGDVLNIFKGRNKALEYVANKKIDASPSSLSKYGNSRGYKLNKLWYKENCNDYPQGVLSGCDSQMGSASHSY